MNNSSKEGQTGIPERKTQTDFSIERILQKDSNPPIDMASNFSWLNCSRFKPPKIPRSKKRSGGKKFRGARVPFAPHQISALERTFEKTQYLSSESIQQLAVSLCLTETRIKIWFQNRRARLRREKEALSTSTSTNDPNKPIGVSPSLLSPNQVQSTNFTTSESPSVCGINEYVSYHFTNMNQFNSSHVISQSPMPFQVGIYPNLERRQLYLDQLFRNERERLANIPSLINFSNNSNINNSK